MGSLGIDPQMLVSRVKHELSDHQGEVSTLTLRGDDVVSTGWDGAVLFWDTKTWEVKQKLEDLPGPILAATYLGKKLVTSSEGELQFWKRPNETEEEEEEDEAPPDPKAKGGKGAPPPAEGTGEWEDYECELRVPLPVPDYTTQANRKVYGLVASGKSILTANRDHIMRAWTLEEVPPEPKPEPEVVEGEGEGEEGEKDPKAAEPPAEEEEPPPPVFEWKVTHEARHPEGVTCLLCLPDGRVASGCLDRRVRVWQRMGRTHEWGIVARIDGHTNAITTLAMAEIDGRSKLLTGAGDASVRIWDMAEWALEAVLQTEETAGGVKSVMQISETQIVVGHGDGSLRVWKFGKIAGQEEPGWLSRRTVEKADSRGCIYAMCVHGSRFLTGGSDGTIRVYQ